MLSHIQNQELSRDVELQCIDKLIDDLDQKHRIQRKIQFLLDVRGFLHVNKITGSYHEFGLYNGHMLYSAHRVLGDIITRYCGFDTFEGEPDFSDQEASFSPYLSKGDYSCSLNQVTNFLSHIDPILIKGDFRVSSVLDQISSLPDPSIVVVDCNILSSVESALRISLKNIVPFGFLFVDDYFTIRDSSSFVLRDLLFNISEHYGRRLTPFMTYPPFSKAFIVH